ncbi:MAG: glutamate--tRNA ligase [Muribaculaceae bacterium]|nr:glutamate--tRNA ligase [Muribaculaceae bacterium]
MTDNRKVRVRFAPSPTGPLHIGGVRTALFNYLFARHHGGDMLLRIEDTDSRRFVPGAEEYIVESLRWLGINIDEGVGAGGDHGPYRQSERRDIYRKYVRQLLDEGKAYIAFDTPEELEAARTEHPNFQYDASTRGSMRNELTLGKEETQRLIDEGAQYVVRFKIEPDCPVIVNDRIRGEVTVNSNILDDKVLYKSADDLPTYHLANIVDDHLMEVTHVIRGEEWLPSAPLHVLLYRALGWEDTMPEFVHLPLLLKPVGNGKLSKRDGDKLGFPVFPLEWHDPASGAVSSGYREQGYLPEAVVNFLALLGWNPGDDTEMMDMQQLIEKFSFAHCSKAGAKFDYKKGMWFNHEYMLLTPDERLAELFRPVLEEKGVTGFSDEYVARAIGMVKSRANLIPELWDQADFFFRAPEEYAPKDVKKRWSEEMPAIMEELIGVLEGIDDMTSANAEKIVLGWIADKGYHLGNVMNAFRLAVVGACRGPHMFDITELMPRQEVLARLRRAIDSINK